MCDKGLSREQLACGNVTAQVLVKTSEGRYIGETRYTYNVDLVAQLEQCVRALDDEDMELEFTRTTDEQHVALNYRRKLKISLFPPAASQFPPDGFCPRGLRA